MMAERNESLKKPSDFIECDCLKCSQKESCIHKDAYRRLPKEVGGLGLCKNLKDGKIGGSEKR